MGISFRSRKVDAELDKELSFHIEQRICDLTMQGLSAEEAHRRARLEFGSLEQIKEECRDIWSFRKPAIVAAGILTLVLGIGAATMLFRTPERRASLKPGADAAILAVPATVDLFSSLGVPASIGRTFQMEDLDNGCTVVLSHKFWESSLGGNPNAVGRTLSLNHKPCIVIGVMPADFTFYPETVELWSLVPPSHSNS